MRHPMGASAKATLEQVEYRDAVTRARSAAEARYQTELRRERQAYWYAREVQYSDAGTGVNTNLDFALQTRGSEFMREKDVERNPVDRLVRFRTTVGRTTPVRSPRD